MARLLFELSGEHPELPAAEVAACFESLDIPCETVEQDEMVLVVECGEVEVGALRERIALSHIIDEHVFSCLPGDFPDFMGKIKLRQGSFAVRLQRIGENHPDISLSDMARFLGKFLNKEHPVDLERPDQEVRLVLAERLHCSVKLAEVDRTSFEKRKVQYRPYFSPVSLHPKLARALVNLSRVKSGGTLFDPFCGTGGVLIEAGLMGMNVVGTDISEEMTAGCVENLEHFGIRDYKIYAQDFEEGTAALGNAGGTEIDGIATDPPYGRSTTTAREDLNHLFERSFRAFSRVLRGGKHLSIVLPEERFVELGKEHLHLQEKYSLRVHRSMTRHFCVYRGED